MSITAVPGSYDRDDADYWRDRGRAALARNIVDNGVPMLLWGGWGDVLETGTVRAYVALLNAHALRAGAKSAKEWLQKAKLKETEVRKGLRADLLTTKTIDALMGHAKLTGAGAGETKK